MVSPDFHSKRFVLVTTATSKDHLLGARETVLQCLYEVGLIPVIVHAGMDFEVVQELLYAAAGVVLTGGPDVDPAHYNQESHEKTQASDPLRDNFELSVIKISDELNLPILAICRGAQILWVSGGGQLLQEVGEVVPEDVERFLPCTTKRLICAHKLDSRLLENHLTALLKYFYIPNDFFNLRFKVILKHWLSWKNLKRYPSLSFLLLLKLPKSMKRMCKGCCDRVQKKLLESEGVEVSSSFTIDIEKYRYLFPLDSE